jgi:ubiquinone/menaquinone biosynthesis C-methylase UbiE
MSLLVPPRRPSAERLDDPTLPADEMRRSLEDIRLVNRRWGGSRALARCLLGRLDRNARPRTRILDVGAGSGDVAQRLERDLRRAGCDARVVALDLQWRHLAAGRAMTAAPPVASVAADAFRLPFADRSFDFSVSTLFFHHFSPEANASILRELSRVARRGFAVLDLTRNLIPWAFVAIAGRAVFRTRVSVEDGMASVLQAYTPDEAESIARLVSPDAAARRVFPYRFLLQGGRA